VTFDELIRLRLATDRLVLRVLDSSFAATALRYHLHNREHFRRAGARVEPEFFTEAFQRRRLAHEFEQMRKDLHLRLFLFAGDDHDFSHILGDLGFSHIIRGALWSCFLGYKIDRDHLRKGYATEAITYSLKHMFDTYGLHRVEANIMPSNTASIGVVEKVGFKREGYSPRYLKIDGQWEDHFRYAILSDEYERPG
jgi:ribosomal-protein-alanine N-acetyltransferase